MVAARVSSTGNNRHRFALITARSQHLPPCTCLSMRAQIFVYTQLNIYKEVCMKATSFKLSFHAKLMSSLFKNVLNAKPFGSSKFCFTLRSHGHSSLPDPIIGPGSRVGVALVMDGVGRKVRVWQWGCFSASRATSGSLLRTLGAARRER